MHQPDLFEGQTSAPTVDEEQLMLYALGDFQARGKVLAERELPLDRLRGAIRRACETFGSEMPTDERAVATLARLGAQVRRVPAFIAKHPFRVTVTNELANRARDYYTEMLSNANS